LIEQLSEIVVLRHDNDWDRRAARRREDIAVPRTQQPEPIDVHGLCSVLCSNPLS
jgi:hypothetical protein